jgi:hypothetical protein
MNAAPDMHQPIDTVQKTQPMRIRFRRPLVDVPTAMALIDVSSQERLMALIEDGSLRWAFDISCSSVTRREVRILAESINDFLAGERHPELSEADEFTRMLALIFPGEPGPDIRSVELERVLSVSQTHIKSLMASGHLIAVKGSVPRVGRLGSVRIQFSSVRELLKRRRVY